MWINDKQFYICDNFDDAVDKHFEFGGEIYGEIRKKYKGFSREQDENCVSGQTLPQ